MNETLKYILLQFPFSYKYIAMVTKQMLYLDGVVSKINNPTHRCQSVLPFFYLSAK